MSSVEERLFGMAVDGVWFDGDWRHESHEPQGSESRGNWFGGPSLTPIEEMGKSTVIYEFTLTKSLITAIAIVLNTRWDIYHLSYLMDGCVLAVSGSPIVATLNLFSHSKRTIFNQLGLLFTNPFFMRKKKLLIPLTNEIFNFK